MIVLTCYDACNVVLSPSAAWWQRFQVWSDSGMLRSFSNQYDANQYAYAWNRGMA